MSKRGFGGMSKEKQREIASKGGKAAHALGRAHTWTQEEAREAGKKGQALHPMTPERAAEIGRMGGVARRERMKERALAESTPQLSEDDIELNCHGDGRVG